MHVYYEIWVLHEYGVNESWNKAWKIEPTYIPQIKNVIYPLRFISNGEFLLFAEDCFDENYGLFHLYNLGNEENEYLNFINLMYFFCGLLDTQRVLFQLKEGITDISKVV